jgi:hypothetical protein
LPDERLRDAVQAAERFADGRATKDELAAAHTAVSWMTDDSGPFGAAPPGVRVGIDMAVAVTAPQAFEAAFAMTATSTPLAGRMQTTAAEAYLCQLLRCIFGNPFRPVSTAPVWRTWRHGTVAKLARTIYEECRFTDLPVLADALEEAGCNDENILGHLRGPGPHAGGCWVVDLCMGKGNP